VIVTGDLCDKGEAEAYRDLRAAPLYASRMVGGLRVITLDTSVRGYHYGSLDRPQLEWLAGELAEPAPEGTILAMHHPPIRLVQPIARATELRDVDTLDGIIRNSDVGMILAGHLHTSSTGTFAGIPVSAASATSTPRTRT
jgi:Icc protein